MEYFLAFNIRIMNWNIFTILWEIAPIQHEYFNYRTFFIYADQYKQPVSHCQKIDQRKRWAFLLIKNLAFLTYFWSLWNVIWNSLRLISRIVIYFKLLLRVSTLDIPQIIKCVTQWIIFVYFDILNSTCLNDLKTFIRIFYFWNF